MAIDEPAPAPPLRNAPAIPNRRFAGSEVTRVLDEVRRRWIPVVALVAVTGIAASLVAGTLPSCYAAEGMIAVEAPRVNVIGIEGVTKDLKTDYAAGLTEAAVLRSRTVATTAVEMIRRREPRAFAALAAPVRADPGERIGSWLLARFGPRTWPAPEPGLPDEEQLADRLLAGLEVTPVDYSYLIRVGFTAQDPRLAAAAVNAVIESYVASRADTQAGESARAVGWLERQVTALRTRVIESEARLERARAASGNIELAGRDRLKTRYARMSAELSDVRLERATMAARLRNVQRTLRNGGKVAAIPVALDSALVRTLRERETEMQRLVAQLATQLRDGHPRMIRARREAADLAARIDIEARKLLRGQQNDLELVTARETQLAGALQAIERRIESIGHEHARIRALSADAAATRQIYETVLARYKETRAVNPQEVAGPPVRVLNRATVPGRPFAPNATLLVVGAMSVSLVIAVSAAVLREATDRGFRSVRQVADVARLPVLGAVPMTMGADRERAPHEVIAQRRDSMVGEAVNGLRTSLAMAAAVAPRTVMFTSSLSAEGKTSTSLAVASLAAVAGRRAVVIDCDVRNPNVHTALGADNGLGLTQCLLGECGIDAVVRRMPDTGLFYVTAGSRPPHPGDLLGSARMAEMLSWCRENFDLVVIDTPPVLAVSDALMLLRQVDAAVYVVAWADTPRTAVLAGLRQIHAVGGAPTGVVLSRLDLRKTGFEDVRGLGYGVSLRRYSDVGGHAAA